MKLFDYVNPFLDMPKFGLELVTKTDKLDSSFIDDLKNSLHPIKEEKYLMFIASYYVSPLFAGSFLIAVNDDNDVIYQKMLTIS